MIRIVTARQLAELTAQADTAEKAADAAEQLADALRIDNQRLAEDCNRLTRQLLASRDARTIARQADQLTQLQAANEAMSRELYDRAHQAAEEVSA
jgi:hypothetical protein